MKSSGCPQPSTSTALFHWLSEHSPGVYLEVRVDWGCSTGFSLSILPCGSVQKYTLLQILIDSDDFRSSWGNRAMG